MEKTETSGNLSHFTTPESILTAILQTTLDEYNSPGKPDAENQAAIQLMERMFARALELGCAPIDIVRSALKGIPNSASREEYLVRLEEQNVYQGGKAISPQDLLTLRQEFSLETREIQPDPTP